MSFCDAAYCQNSLITLLLLLLLLLLLEIVVLLTNGLKLSNGST